MDNLQHIDDLLKKSATSFVYAEVGATDWLAVEKKLKQRKKRIYALWFFLALVFVSSSIVLVNFTSSEESPIVSHTITQNLDQQSFDQLENTNQNVEQAIEQSIITENTNEASTTEAPIRERNHTSTSSLSEETIPSIAESPVEQIASSEAIPTSDLDPIPTEVKNTTDHVEIVAIPDIKSDNSTKNQELEDQTTDIIDAPIVKTTPTLPKPLKDGTTGNDNGENHTKGHWEAGFSFTPSISNKRISENATLAGLIHVNYYDKAASSEKSSVSNSAGLNAQYHLSNGLFIATGAFISQRSESINYNYTIDSIPLIENNNVITTYQPQVPVPVKHNGSNSYHFLEIPLNIGYKTPISANFEIRSQVGMSYMLLFNQKGKKADYNNLSLKDLSEYSLNKNNIAANAKVGVYWNKKQFTIGAEPIFSYNLNNLNDKETSAIIVKPYSYGFNISTNYKFIK